jgi:predicted porin
MSATFDTSDIYASVAYESRNDATTLTKADTAMRAVGKYSLADFWVGAMVESMKSNTSATVSASGNNMEFVGGYKMGPNQFSASYAKAGSYAVGAAASNAISQLSLKYAYNFSKRTEVFAAYASRKTDLTTVADTSYVGGGIVHSF